jgi:hypothetical protein
MASSRSSIRALAGVERSTGLHEPNTPAEWLCVGLLTRSGGSAFASASSANRSADGVAGSAQNISSVVRATPWGVPKPGS